MPYSRSLELSQLIKYWKFVPFAQHLPIFPTQLLTSTILPSGSKSLTFLASVYKWDHVVSVCVWLISLGIVSPRFIRVVLLFSSCTHPLSLSPLEGNFQRMFAHTSTSVGLPLPLALWPFAASPVVSTALLSLHFCWQSLKMILTGSQASWGPESAEQEGTKGHRTVEGEAANLKAEPIPLDRSGEESHHLWLEAQILEQVTWNAVSCDQMTLGKSFASLCCHFPIRKMGMTVWGLQASPAMAWVKSAARLALIPFKAFRFKVEGLKNTHFFSSCLSPPVFQLRTDITGANKQNKPETPW